MSQKRCYPTVLRALVLGLLLLAPTLALAEACPVPPQAALSERDMARIRDLEASRTRGLGSALVGESAEERAVVSTLFAQGLTPVDASRLPGAYQCRTIKLGGNLPLVVYQWFRCEIAPQGDGFSIAKTTGSQNFSGVLLPTGDGRFLYRGASTYGYEAAGRDYGSDPDRDQVGCLSAVDAARQHFLLELPVPVLESYHDLIELRP